MAPTMTLEEDPGRRLRQSWGESLTAEMAAAGVGVPELRRRLAARGVVVTRQAIYYWMSGDAAPAPDKQAAIAAAIGVPPRRLFPLEPVD